MTTPNWKWAKWVEQNITGRWPYRTVAARAQIHPSYIGQFVSKGQTPSREVVVRLAEAIDADVNRALLAAGYAPLVETEAPDLDPELLEVIQEIDAAPRATRKLAISFLKGLLAAMPATE